MPFPPEPPPSSFAIEARNVRRTFDHGQVQALRGVNLAVAAGEFVAIQGPSGCGKTTLLQILGGFDAPDEGEVCLRGRPLGPVLDLPAYRARTVGFIFQAACLLPTLTALQNVQIPMLEMPWPASERRRRAEALLEAVDLAERFHHRPPNLSGGERQRVAIARSLANEPEFLLADEPTGNLDRANAARILAILKALHREQGMTTILVSHDEAVAANADRVLRMVDGRVVGEAFDHAVL